MSALLPKGTFDSVSGRPTEGRIPTEPVEQIERDRGGKFLKTWPSPFRLPHPGGFGSRGTHTVPACHL
jgi:hypothetical protein